MLDLYRAAAGLGYTGARIPEEEGGGGLTHVMRGLLDEGGAPGARLLDPRPREHGQAHPHERDARAEGALSARSARRASRLAGTAASEPNVGSDPRGIETTAVLDGDHYVLNGTKLWITNGPIIDLALVVASLGRDPSGRNLITRFVVDRAESPFESREIPTVGIQQGPLGELFVPRLGCPGPTCSASPATPTARSRSPGSPTAPASGCSACTSCAQALGLVAYAGQRDAVRPAHRALPARAGDARRDGHRDRRQPPAMLPRPRVAGPGRLVSPRVVHGQGLRHRGGGAGDQPRDPAPRLVRALEGRRRSRAGPGTRAC